MNTHLMVQPLWKKNVPHWRHLLDPVATVLNFHDNRSKIWPEIAIFGHQISHKMSLMAQASGCR